MISFIIHNMIVPENNSIWTIIINIIGIFLVIFGSYYFYISPGFISSVLCIFGFAIILEKFRITKILKSIIDEYNLLVTVIKIKEESCFFFHSDLTLLSSLDVLGLTEKNNISNMKDLIGIIDCVKFTSVVDKLYTGELYSINKDVRAANNRLLRLYGTPLSIMGKTIYYLQIKELKFWEYNDQEMMKGMMDGATMPLAVLNSQERIKYANSEFFRYFDVENTIVGKYQSMFKDSFSEKKCHWEKISQVNGDVLFAIKPYNTDVYEKIFFERCVFPIVITDRNWNILVTNSAGKNIVDNNQNFWELVSDGEQKLQSLQKFLPLEISTKFSKEKTCFDFNLKNSLEFFRAFLIPIIELNESHGWFIILYNNKEEKETERHILHLQRLSNLGQLLTQIVHDINNNLTAALGFCDILSSKDISDSQGLFVNKIKDSIGRAANLSRRLLSSSKKQIPEKYIRDVNNSIQQILDTTGKLMGENIQVVFRAGKDLKPIAIDETSFEQIVVNIMINARDAMPKGGVVEIKTILRTITGETASKHSVQEGEYVEFSVKDTGIGIRKENLNKVCDAFFTTKTDQGTGMGLFTVQSVIKDHHGFLDIISEEDKGAEFIVCFPCTVEIIQKKDQDNAIVIPSLGSSQNKRKITVLFVEDEALIQGFAVPGLEQYGFHVISASSGEEIMGKIDSLSQVEVLITDIMMPGMDGIELTSQLAKKFPQIKVIFMSGYDISVVNELERRKRDKDGMENFFKVSNENNANVVFLSKPFSLTDLVSAIDRVSNYESQI